MAFERSAISAVRNRRAISMGASSAPEARRSGLSGPKVITPAASFTRNLLRVADFLPLLYGFGLASMLVRKDFKRLGDIAAATLVVHRPLPSPKIELQEIEPLAPARPLAPQDQAAVIALAARASRLTPERLDELAALAAPISGNAGGDAGQTGPQVTQRVLAVAQWLLGKR